MSFLLRTLQLLSLTIWVGGIAFFAFVLAPVAFHHLPDARLAGTVVRESILNLHRIGLTCGAIFLVALFLVRDQTVRKIFFAQAFLATLMCVLTFFSQNRILPRMETDRLSSGDSIDRLPQGDPARLDFDRLHVLSVRIEGAIFLAGIGVIALMPAAIHPSTPIAR